MSVLGETRDRYLADLQAALSKIEAGGGRLTTAISGIRESSDAITRARSRGRPSAPARRGEAAGGVVEHEHPVEAGARPRRLESLLARGRVFTGW